ncbi:urea carboxylase [Arthrobacter sp. ok909]|uniref:urea carboxylase n=1 Tax=Arthrobacter sp. ok909 TaxID=1761746 RepID=UPI000885EE91|nr:urea carboxylase [Arthrobacter sp. ok909]SDP57652.1 urea carboxylase [Arthrobacter sp. ok909]
MNRFDTLLIANRGEIACRIIESARKIGLRTVAVYSEADRGARHVRLADEAVLLGPAPAKESYLKVEALLTAAAATGAGAIHPGYGFLSEDAGFAEAVEAAGLVFVGPTPDQLRIFGTKHTARDAARAAGVPMIAGSGLLPDIDAAVLAARDIGFPLMLKATGGGGGIGMTVCRTEDELTESYPRVARLAGASFSTAGVFAERYVEHARHVEVQIFGDGDGRVVSLGDRDCSLQRRHQKVLEEAPAPDLPDALREELHRSSRALCGSLDYRSAGTVEFVYDPVRQEASFLEVNARLQVEHPVTEAVTGVDLVEWMLRLAQGGTEAAGVLAGRPDSIPVSGYAVEARLYAEDPARNFQPSSGTVTNAAYPATDGVRVDAWVETGSEVSTNYDPLLAKIITTGTDRNQAFDRLGAALKATRIDGIETNLGMLRAVTALDVVRDAAHSTGTLNDLGDPEPRITVERPGLQTSVQDWPGRAGLWQVGVPPSGPMDDLSFRLGNQALGNPEGAPGLEFTMTGPSLHFTHATTVCVAGAPTTLTVDGTDVPAWEPVTVPAGGTLDVGTAEGSGLRGYILFQGGLDVPQYLGSASTFTLGQFGGHGGRVLRSGDVLRAVAPAPAPEATAEDPAPAARPAAPGQAGPVPLDSRPVLTSAWELTVVEGPHGAPEFFQREDIEDLYAASYEVHFNSARTGVRLIGPKPRWARSDGGEAGLHPSNIHDTAYSVGALDFTGDTPILLGPDGPSLGGFVCPVTVVTADRWKLGQLRPGDTVRFVPVEARQAPSAKDLGPGRQLVLPGDAGWSRPAGGAAASLKSGAALPSAGLNSGRALQPAGIRRGDGDDGVLGRVPEGPGRPAVTYRRSGDDNLLVEYGDMVLDLSLRARVHALHQHLEELRMPGIVDLTPGIRSLQIKIDPTVLPAPRLLGLVQDIEAALPASSELVVPSRTVRLPLSWDDPATREAIQRYMAGVRDDAPWCPWNIEFIRRINGLESVNDVFDTVFNAEYLVLGLGDVYLGAPVATPLDPRHRLVTTKYNPARTWTPENAVGIGGAYMCIYGMEGPGGYQFVGRTTQVWSRYADSAPFEPGSPWLLRFFDRISWYPVSPEELLDLRADMAAGRGRGVDIEDGTFSLADHEDFLARNSESIAVFREQQAAAFAVERQAWADAGEFDRADAAAAVVPEPGELVVPDGGTLVSAPFAASVWKVDVTAGEHVVKGQPLVSLEAMKMETVLTAPCDGVVQQVLPVAGSQVVGGEALVVLGLPVETSAEELSKEMDTKELDTKELEEATL